MKQETVILILKGLCYVTIGALTPMSAALAQWANSGEWPPKIIWIVIIIAAITGAATQLLSFLSQAYSTFKEEQKNGNGKTTNEIKQ